MIKIAQDIEKLDFPSCIGANYVVADGNHIDYRGNGHGIRVYVASNDNLQPVVHEIRGNANGTSRVFEDASGEDIPQELFKHTSKFRDHDRVQTYGISGTDFGLNTLFNNRFRDEGSFPDGYRDLFLFDDSGEEIVYEDPVKLLEAINEMRENGKKIGIVGDTGTIFWFDPLKIGKHPDYCVLGIMNDRLMGIIDDMVSCYDVTIEDSEVARHINGVKNYLTTRCSEEDFDYYNSCDFNSEKHIRLRMLGRKLRQISPEAASEFFGRAIDQYKGIEVDMFGEDRFQYLARASAQHVLGPLGVEINAWEIRTRSAEAALVRHYTQQENSGGKGAEHKALLSEIVESHTSATARGLESLRSYAKIPASRMSIVDTTYVLNDM